MKPAKKNTRKNGTKGKETKSQFKSVADMRAYFESLGPMRLRKYAISGLNVPAEVADEWNDLDFMVDYCVKKATGEELPEHPKEPDLDYGDDDEGSVEFDAAELTEEKEEDDDDAFNFDNEREDSDDFEFVVGGEEAEPETEVEPEPPKPKKTRKPRAKKTKEKVEPASSDNDDVNVAIRQMLDVITNQGVAIETLVKSNARLESMCKEMYIRQEANHSALSTLAKTVFYMSTMMSEFVPRVLRTMRFSPSNIKEIRNKADSAGVDAKELFDSLIDPDAESEVD